MTRLRKCPKFAPSKNLCSHGNSLTHSTSLAQRQAPRPDSGVEPACKSRAVLCTCFAASRQACPLEEIAPGIDLIHRHPDCTTASHSEEAHMYSSIWPVEVPTRIIGCSCSVEDVPTFSGSLHVAELPLGMSSAWRPACPSADHKPGQPAKAQWLVQPMFVAARTIVPLSHFRCHLRNLGCRLTRLELKLWPRHYHLHEKPPQVPALSL